MPERACVYCGCTEHRACVLAIAELAPTERAWYRSVAHDAGRALGDRVTCRWISAHPPVCSAPTCAAKHAEAASR